MLSLHVLLSIVLVSRTEVAMPTFECLAYCHVVVKPFLIGEGFLAIVTNIGAFVNTIHMLLQKRTIITLIVTP